MRTEFSAGAIRRNGRWVSFSSRARVASSFGGASFSIHGSTSTSPPPMPTSMRSLLLNATPTLSSVLRP
jgi:hypothetical protein